MGARGQGTRQSRWRIRHLSWLGCVLQRPREMLPLGRTPTGMFPPALLLHLGQFPKRNEEMLSFATTFMDVSLKHPREGGGCFRAAPQFHLRRPCTSPGQQQGHG